MNPDDQLALRFMERRRREAPRSCLRRPWWDFNLLVLALALFSLTYVRHFWDIGVGPTVFSVLLVFLAWIGLGPLGLFVQMISERRRLARLLQELEE